MTATGIKELIYLRLLPEDEMADQICCLPYTLVETIIEDALKDEDGYIDYLTDIVNTLKKNMNQNSKKALRKLLKVSQILGCIGYFDFGEWDAFRDNENRPAALTACEILLFNYPAFREHFSKLKAAGIIDEIENGLKWNRSKTAAAEYFERLDCLERNRRWIVVENVFGFEHLCQTLNTHRERQGKEKPSKDFEEIKLLLDLD